MISLLGRNIKNYREKRGLNLRRLVEIAGVGYATIHDLENGKKQNISSTTLEKVANALEISTDVLLGMNISVMNNSLEDNINKLLEYSDIDGITLSCKEKDILRSICINGIGVIRLMRELGDKTN